MHTISRVEKILETGNLADFLGQPEDSWFEAKGAAAYDLDSAANRWELGKDVSALANNEGGFLLVGLRTKQLRLERTDVVEELDLVPNEPRRIDRMSGVLREILTPRLKRLDITWREDRDQPGKGVIAIRVPELPIDDRFVLVGQAMEGSERLTQTVFGYVVRKGAQTIPLTIEDLQQRFKRGSSSSANQLQRIEEKLDSLSESFHRFEWENETVMDWDLKMERLRKDIR